MTHPLVARNAALALDPQTLPRLAAVSTATATLILLKLGIRACFVAGARPLSPAASRFAAEAFTLRFIPMREDLSRPEVLAEPDYAPRRLIEEIPAGRALVVDARGVTTAGIVGDILAARLAERGCAAIVTDGAVRDVAALRAGPLPVFCAGAAAPASLNAHYGADTELPIGCGGVAIVPGDIMIGDADGVVVVPRALADAVAREAFEQERLERFLRLLVARGRPTVGTYPPNDATRCEYEQWLAEGEPELSG
jgi:regulator of RNase E activity RraA